MLRLFLYSKLRHSPLNSPLLDIQSSHSSLPYSPLLPSSLEYRKSQSSPGDSATDRSYLSSGQQRSIIALDHGQRSRVVTHTYSRVLFTLCLRGVQVHTLSMNNRKETIRYLYIYTTTAHLVYYYYLIIIIYYLIE